MPDVFVRNASEDDLAAIAAVAVATGQTEEWSGSDPAYVRHLLAHGHVVVAEREGVVAGFGAARQIRAAPAGPARPARPATPASAVDPGDSGRARSAGTGVAGTARPPSEGGGEVTMLCDLFVDPQSHGAGLGQVMLSALWRPGTPRMTFSSMHPHALPLYTRAGLDAWWPLLYLAGDVRATRPPAGWTIGEAAADDVSGLERAWTGLDRSADIHAWAARPAGRPVSVARDGQPLAAGVFGGAGTEYGVIHLASAPHVSDDDARDALLTAVSALDAAVGRGRVCLPAPHPAVRPLLAAGWRVEYADLFMASDPALLDPRRAVPSPAFA